MSTARSQRPKAFDSLTLKRILRECCRVGVSLETNTTDLDVEEVASRDTIYHEYLCTLLLYGSSMNVIFKLHSMGDDLRHIAAPKYRCEISKINQSQIRDTLKEISNILAGKIQSLFKELKLDIFHSLPFCIEGYNEIFFQRKEVSLKDNFAIVGPDFKIVVSEEFEITEPSSLPPLDGIDVNSLISGKKNPIEFF